MTKPATTRIVLSLLLLAPLFWSAPAVAEEPASPWVLLTQLRAGLEEAGPITARFVQTYVPAGFSTGDQENGFLSLWLPRCLRWNYLEPEMKSFLLCEDEVWAWNPQEEGGRHYQIEPEQEPGLDLLLVAVDRLRERYVASSEQRDDGTYDITMATPPDAAESFRAVIRIDPVAERVAGLEYTDGEGNVTRFEISEYQPLTHTALFNAPGDLRWTEE
jgi:outer membrane lipoprotein-sorting protein